VADSADTGAADSWWIAKSNNFPHPAYLPEGEFDWPIKKRHSRMRKPIQYQRVTDVPYRIPLNVYLYQPDECFRTKMDFAQ